MEGGVHTQGSQGLWATTNPGEGREQSLPQSSGRKQPAHRWPRPSGLLNRERRQFSAFNPGCGMCYTCPVKLTLHPWMLFLTKILPLWGTRQPITCLIVRKASKSAVV